MGSGTPLQNFMGSVEPMPTQPLAYSTLLKILVSILGILFTKTLSKIQNEGVKRAEVAAWFKNYDEAEKLYLDADMRMLAVRMRKRLGDWFKVVQLLKTGTGGNDAEIEEAYNEVIFLGSFTNYVDWKGGYEIKVVQLLKTGTGGNDAEIEEAYNEVFFLGSFTNYVDSKGGGMKCQRY